MKAMILAAGRGERMRPLTDSCPKPLLKVAGKPLIEYHIEKLAEIGIQDVVINLAWLGDNISHYLGNGSRWGLTIHYSYETAGALETAGGIKKALPKLIESEAQEDDTPFLLINGDVYCEDSFQCLPQLNKGESALLWLVENPEHHRKGDFMLNDGKISNLPEADGVSSYTYAGVALFRPSFFDALAAPCKVYALGPMLRVAADKGMLAGKVMLERWVDVGTPERLEKLNQDILGNL